MSRGRTTRAQPGNAAVSTFTQQVTTLDFKLCYRAYTIPLHNPTQIIRAGDCGGFPVAGSSISIGESSTTE